MTKLTRNYWHKEAARRGAYDVPDAFRGNCACGGWLIIPVDGFRAGDPLRCRCGREYFTRYAAGAYELVCRHEGVDVVINTE